MATQASDVIRATTEILRSGRESEEFKEYFDLKSTN